MKFILAFLLCVLFSMSAQAQYCLPHFGESLTNKCDYCIASQGVSPLEAGSSGIRWDVRYLYLGDQFSGSTKLPKGMANESYLTNQLTGFYRISSAFTAVVILPYTIRSEHEPVSESMEEIARSSYAKPQHEVVETGATSTELVTANGFGDAIAMGRYTIIKFGSSDEKEDQMSDGSSGLTILSFSAGVKLPTGRTDVMHDGEYLDSHLQPGSGSTDLVLGSSILWAQDRTMLSANILGSITGTGAREHRFGNYINLDLTSRYKLFSSEDEVSTLSATLGLSGELRAKETQDKAELDNSGGSVVYLSPGIQWMLSEKISLEINYHLPIYHYLGGTQLGESYRLMGGVQYLF